MALALHTLLVWSAQDTIDDRMLRLAMSAWDFIVNHDTSRPHLRVELAQQYIANRVLGEGQWRYTRWLPGGGEIAIRHDLTRALDFTTESFPKLVEAEDLALLVADIEEDDRDLGVTLDRHYCDADGQIITE